MSTFHHLSTLCFLGNPKAAFLECAQVLRDKGRLVIGTIPADSSFGRAYVKKSAGGHPIYSHARFYAISEIIRLAEAANFELRDGCSILFWGPGGRPSGPLRAVSAIIAQAGFVGLLFEAR